MGWVDAACGMRLGLRFSGVVEYYTYGISILCDGDEEE